MLTRPTSGGDESGTNNSDVVAGISSVFALVKGILILNMLIVIFIAYLG